MQEINEYSNVNYCKKLAHKEVTHIDLPSNIIKRYAFINIHNPSYYDVELYTADPMTDRFIKPFCKIYQNSYLSVEIPSDMTLNGLFLYPVYNMNNSVDYCEDIYLTFSKHSNYWNEKGKEINNIVLPNTYLLDDTNGIKYNKESGNLEIDIINEPFILDIIQSNSAEIFVSFYIDNNDLSIYPHTNINNTLQFIYGAGRTYEDFIQYGERFFVIENMNKFYAVPFYSIALYSSTFTKPITLKNFKVYLP